MCCTSDYYKYRIIGGAKRSRTADPLHAMQVLYQLSYSPSLGVVYYRVVFTIRQALFLKKFKKMQKTLKLGSF